MPSQVSFVEVTSLVKATLETLISDEVTLRLADDLQLDGPARFEMIQGDAGEQKWFVVMNWRSKSNSGSTPVVTVVPIADPDALEASINADILTNEAAGKTLIGWEYEALLQAGGGQANRVMLTYSEDSFSRAIQALTRAVSGGQTTNGASLAIALYDIDMTELVALVNGLQNTISALNDTVLIGAAQWDKSYQLDGTAAVVLTADGQTYQMVLVAIEVAGAIELHAVFGDEAADAAELTPTGAEVQDALLEAAITDHNPAVGLIVGRIKIQRTAVDTMVMTHENIASTASLVQERAVGNVL